MNTPDIEQLNESFSLDSGDTSLRFRAGDTETARSELKQAIELFDKNNEKIVNIEKAEILRSVAESYKSIGDISLSREIYKRAIEAGIENPNSRPRAEDLSATCCSMAFNNVDPGAELLARIKEIKTNLSDPW